MVRMMTAAIAILVLAGCNNDDERIQELEAKIERMESQRGGQSAAAPGPVGSASPAASSGAAPARLAGPVASAASVPGAPASPNASPNASRANASTNICNDGSERYLTLVNRGDRTIMYFYASPPSADGWEEDVLGDEVVSLNERFRINFNSDERCTCVYDTKAVLDDDSEVVRKANVCTDHLQAYP